MMWTARIFAGLLFGVAIPCSLAQHAGDKRTPLVEDQRAFADVTGSAVAARDWRIDMSPALGIASLPRRDIDDFVMKYLGFNADEASVCSATFADLADDGSYQLIASIDQSGRMFCNEVLVVQKDNAGFKSATLEAWWPGDVSKSVKDLAGDGRKELLVQQSLSPYEGAKCIATWERLFQIRDGALADVSSEFPNFYKARLDELRRELTGNREGSVCRQIEIDKIERVMGAKPDAGFARAQEWMKSDDASLRLKAVDVLSDIRDQKSLEALRKATQDKDVVVSNAAKSYLGQPITE